MPLTPIYSSILHEEGEICPHNKIAKTIKTVYNQSSPVRLKDECHVRKLGDQQHRPGSEYDCCNYLWSVTLQRGTNPYEAKKEPNTSNKFKTLPQAVYERLRNSFQRYRTQLTTPKTNSNMPMEWIMKPRDLVSISSKESNLNQCSNKIKGKASSIRSCLVPTSHKKESLRAKAMNALMDTVIARSDGASASGQESLEAKSEKNQVNERRRIVASHLIDSAAEQLQPGGGGRRTIVVKKQLADDFSNEEFAPSKQTQQETTLHTDMHAANGAQTKRALQLTWAPLPAVSPAIAPLPQQKRAQICLLEKLNLTEYLQELSNAPTRKGSNENSSITHSGVTCHALCGSARRAGGAAHTLGVQRKSALRKKPNDMRARKKHAYNDEEEEVEILDMEALRLLNKTLKRKKQKSVYLETEDGTRNKKKSSYRHYRVVGRRAQRKRIRDKTKTHLGAEETSEMISKSNCSIRSDTTALLSEASKEVEAVKQNKIDNCEELKEFLKELKIANSTLPPAAEVINHLQIPIEVPAETKLSEKSDAHDGLSEQSDYIISFHTPITLRTLIERRARAKHLAGPQQIKHANGNLFRAPILRTPLWARARGSSSPTKHQTGI